MTTLVQWNALSLASLKQSYFLLKHSLCDMYDRCKAKTISVAGIAPLNWITYRRFSMISFTGVRLTPARSQISYLSRGQQKKKVPQAGLYDCKGRINCTLLIKFATCACMEFYWPIVCHSFWDCKQTWNALQERRMEIYQHQRCWWNCLASCTPFENSIKLIFKKKKMFSITGALVKYCELKGNLKWNLHINDVDKV